MIVFPAAKINLGLYVTDRRNDGYHNIETLFYPIGLTDILELVPAPELGSGNIEITLSGIYVEGNAESNLVVKAYRMVHESVSLPGVKAFLHKCIPTGAGLGGGSSDGAFMLKLLSRVFGLGLTADELFAMALSLGSDCPFFLESKPSLARGRGEMLTAAPFLLKGCYIQLFHPGTGISTAAAYRNVPVGPPDVSLDVIANGPVSEWKGAMKNSFEKYAFEQQPVIGQIKESLYRAGALYSSMTGSGSAVFGLFDRETPTPSDISRYLIWKEIL